MSEINKKGVILLLSGKVTTLSQTHSFAEENYDIYKIDEKDLINFKSILRIVKGKGYSELFIGILNYKNQRFLFFLNLISVLSFVKNPFIIDENGKNIKFGLLRLIFWSLPVFIIGLLYSLLIVPSYLLIYKILKWKYLKTS
jgi:hypothetical protein